MPDKLATRLTPMEWDKKIPLGRLDRWGRRTCKVKGQR